MVKRSMLAVFVCGFVLLPTSSAFACGGLIGPRGAVNLTRTTTLAAYHAGVEHYITSFDYAGGGGAFGSIVPLPAVPSKVEKGGAWTLQRLQRETAPPQPQVAFAAARSDDGAREVYKTRIDALDITVLQGGASAVRTWAVRHGFRLPPDAPAVLAFYAARSPYFMAAIFDSRAAARRGQQVGDGTPIHLTIPVREPWVPLRILGLGKDPAERLDADVYLLTDRTPNLLPAAGRGYDVERRVPASAQLLADLRSDRGMSWLPASGMTLTHLIVASSSPQLRYDLAINVHGGRPSLVAAGLAPPATPTPAPRPTPRPTPVYAPEPLATIYATAPAARAAPVWPLVVAGAVVAVVGLGLGLGVPSVRRR